MTPCRNALRASVSQLTSPSTRSQLDRLCSELLSTEQRTLPFAERLKSLEPLLVDRQALFQGDPESTTLTLLREQRAFVTAKPGSSERSDHAAPEGNHLADDLIQKATMAPGFRTCELACAKLDLTTAAGQLKALEFAFSSGSTLIARLILYGEKSLAKRHPFLTSLMECRVALTHYYGYCLTVDRTTGKPPKRAEHWSVTGKDSASTALLTAWCKQHLVGFDYYHNEGGVYPLKSAIDGTVFERIKDEDFYCRPGCVRDYCTWMHTMSLADGFANSTTNGFTWLTWCDFYVSHLQRCTRLNNLDEQLAWLRDATDQFVAFQRYVQDHKRQLITSPRLEENVFDAIAPFDVPPAQQIRSANADQEEFLTHRDRWKWLGSAQAPVIDPEKLPLLSSAKAKGEPSQPPKPAPKKANKKPSPTKPSSGKQPLGDDPNAPPAHKKAMLEPGSTANQAVWLKPVNSAKPLLLVSGRVWDVQAVAKHYKTTVAAKCWPTILNRRAPHNKLSNCPSYGKPGCTSIDDAKHGLANFDWEEAAAQFARVPTEDERKKIPPMPSTQQRRNFRQPSA